MTGPVFMRRGASWTHRRREDDQPGGFAHSICGLSFSQAAGVGGLPLVIELGDDQPVTCPECQGAQMVAERDRMLAALPTVFTPKPSAEDAQAWAGPQVEVLVVTEPDGAVQTIVFLDGIEVPYAHLTVADVDPGAGHTRSQWQATTRDVMGDVTMTSSFRSLLVQERNHALSRDRGRYIVDDTPIRRPILKEG